MENTWRAVTVSLLTVVFVAPAVAAGMLVKIETNSNEPWARIITNRIKLRRPKNTKHKFNIK